MDGTIEARKAGQRVRCLERRRGLPAEERGRFSTAICRRLEDLPALREARTILSYRATGEEADLAAFHRWAVEKGREPAFPVSYGAGRMEAYIPCEQSGWERGRYGIWSPVPERSRRIPPEELEAVILPCVGFDGQGGRLGHGGGYYDRYLPRCPLAVRILVAFEAQRLERAETDARDQSVDIIVTETGTWELKDRRS